MRFVSLGLNMIYVNFDKDTMKFVTCEKFVSLSRPQIVA